MFPFSRMRQKSAAVGRKSVKAEDNDLRISSSLEKGWRHLLARATVDSYSSPGLGYDTTNMLNKTLSYSAYCSFVQVAQTLFLKSFIYIIYDVAADHRIANCRTRIV